MFVEPRDQAEAMYYVAEGRAGLAGEESVPTTNVSVGPSPQPFHLPSTNRSAVDVGIPCVRGEGENRDAGVAPTGVPGEGVRGGAPGEGVKWKDAALAYMR